MISPRILLVQVLSLWILDKTRGRESCRCAGQGKAEPQPRQEGFGMLWVDTGGNYLPCPSRTRQLSRAGFGIRAGLGTAGTLGTPGLGCHPWEQVRNCISQWEAGHSQLFHYGCSSWGSSQGAGNNPSWQSSASRIGWFGEPSPHPTVCSALPHPELNLGAKSLLQHKGVAEIPEVLKIKVRELSELCMSVLV